MTSDSDWVEDVRRWCATAGAVTAATTVTAPGAASRPDLDASAGDPPGPEALGYEAAHPALQARHWPDAPLG
jgi:hypothetical protein